MTILTRTAFTLLIAFLLPFGGGSVAHAQQETDSETMEAEQVSFTEKWYFHAHLGARSQNISNADDTDTGGGFGLRVGYGVSPLVTLYLGLDFAGMTTESSFNRGVFGDEYGLGTFELGAQFNFRRDKKLVPYFDAALIGVGSVADESNGDVSITGGGLGAGGGVKYFVSPEFALDGGLYFSTGSYTEVESNGQTDDISAAFNNGRLIVGVSWYPFR